MNVMSQTRARCFRSCPRKYQHLYQLGRKPIATPAELEFGKVTHAWLEQYWLDGYAAAADWIEREIKDPYAQVAHSALAAGYYARWGVGDREYSVLGAEIEFRHPLIPGWEMLGIIDAVVRAPDGDVWLVEHKTVSAKTDIAPGSQYWQKLRLDTQLGTYVRGSRTVLGDEPVGVIYDVLRKPEPPLRATPEHLRRYRKDGVLYANCRERDETPEEYGERLFRELSADGYQRQQVVVLERNEEQAAEAMRSAAHEIDGCAQRGVWPLNPDACFNYGRRCEFWGVCSGEDSLDNDLVFENRERAT